MDYGHDKGERVMTRNPNRGMPEINEEEYYYFDEISQMTSADDAKKTFLFCKIKKIINHRLNICV